LLCAAYCAVVEKSEMKSECRARHRHDGNSEKSRRDDRGAKTRMCSRLAFVSIIVIIHLIQSAEECLTS